MSDVHPMLRRWHALPRADRKAVLERLGPDQRQSLMAMIDAENREAGRQSEAGMEAGGWAMFSAPLAQLLRQIEAEAGAAAARGITSAAATLILASAGNIREEKDREAGWARRLLERGRQWFKDMDL